MLSVMLLSCCCHAAGHAARHAACHVARHATCHHQSSFQAEPLYEGYKVLTIIPISKDQLDLLSIIHQATEDYEKANFWTEPCECASFNPLVPRVQKLQIRNLALTYFYFDFFSFD